MLTRSLVSAVLVCSVTALNAYSQSKTPEQAAVEFYQWYFREMNAEREPRRQPAKIRAGASSRLARWYLSDAYSEYGADYFIDGQDYERAWANNVSARKATISGNRATVNVRLTSPRGSIGFPSKTLNIRMVKEGNLWKIDRVNNYAFP